jgi:uncharacterized damage-inducible protein DinB
MNNALSEAFRHNTWANRELISACRGLDGDRMAASAVGSFGSIWRTLEHIVGAEGGYAKRLAGHGPDWVGADPEPAGSLTLDELARRVDELDAIWDEILSAPIDTERVIVVDRGQREVRAGVYVAQALHHGNSHRDQVCTILTSLGIEPPDLQAWAYAEATGRIWPKR